MWSRLLQVLFFALVVRPVTLVVLGMNVRHRGRLPRSGPAILVANHNSHLDTMALMTLFPLRMVHLLRPVAAADYFLRNRALSWFSRRIIGILPLSRSGKTRREELFAETSAALRRGQIVILYPEGTRGEPERMGDFKSGISHLAADHPDVPVIPVFLHGLGKSLPRGEALLVPFFCDVHVGEPIFGSADRAGFQQSLVGAIQSLALAGRQVSWD